MALKARGILTGNANLIFNRNGYEAHLLADRLSSFVFPGITMTQCIRSDSVCRTLLDVLTPLPAAVAAAQRATETRKERFRHRKAAFGAAVGPSHCERGAARISDIERVSSRSIRLCWSDPLFGHYADQVWRIGLARKDSFCDLSGLAVHRGDVVFSPRLHKRYYPANGDRVILASQVGAVDESIDSDGVSDSRDTTADRPAR
ncbi:DUF3331 domain-containing protein [Paraburkholderia diazotrophica]|uniref:DUF3331 domain-containing protein n=1 Tax=Paraburkholderia diazotrophica TaxID=667676 RepID=UPI003180D580